MKQDTSLSEHDLVGLCFDFFEAGGETVGSTLNWFLMYFALYPDIQEKCHNEIVGALGERSPIFDDRKQLPYLDATIMEFQRISNVVPSSLDHTAKENCEINGFFVPRGTSIFYNLYKFHFDKDYWGDPETCRPERFLSENKKATVRKDYFNPFGMGKRSCLGESLAKAELLIFTAMILKELKISLPKEHPKPDVENAVAGITRTAKPFFIHLSLRG